MWVLEARKDAEKVWFPIVWEEKKDPSNVVDYDIHDEITKDASAVINSNNDTTTGMATVIPWINAPKLIASTSIIWSMWEGTVQATIETSMKHDFNSSWTYNELLTQFTILSDTGTESVKQTDQWIQIPSDWVYMLNMKYQWIVWEMQCTDNLRVNWNTVNSFVGSWSEYWYDDPTEQLFMELKKWDILSVYLQTRHTTSSSYTFNHTVTIWIIKLK